MNTPTWMLALLLTLVPAAALAETQQPQIDHIVASYVEDGEPTDVVWNVTKADLERDHPAVARAVAKPNFVIAVADAEEASTHAFFDEMNQRGATAVSVDGQRFTVGITLGQGMPGGDSGAAGTTGPDAASTSARGAAGLDAGLTVLAVAAAAGLLAVALRRKAP